MTAIKKFEIHLEHDIDEQYQYEPGENLRGNVLLVNNEELRVCSIQIQVRGEATVAWDDESGNGQFSAKETYMETVVELPLTEDATTQALTTGVGLKSATVVTVSRGEHLYPLEIPLLTTLPSSFIGKYGSITYVLKATLREDKLMGLGTTITSEPFLVLRRLDILNEPSLHTAAKLNLNKRSPGFCFCMFGKLTADFVVDKTGHLPGGDIVISAEINNECRQNVKTIQAALVLNSTFHAQQNVRSHSQVVNRKVDNCEVEYNDSRTWTDVRLAVPPYIPESRLDGCDMIDIAYELQLRVEMENEASELKGAIPITIGTLQDERRKTNKRRSTLPSIGGNGTGGVVVGDNQYEMIGVVQEENEDDEDLEVLEDDIDAFRHPMAPGETRQNILFQDFGD